MIAAIALSNGLLLYACNPSNFDHMDGLDLRPVPHPDKMRHKNPHHDELQEVEHLECRKSNRTQWSCRGRGGTLTPL